MNTKPAADLRPQNPPASAAVVRAPASPSGARPTRASAAAAVDPRRAAASEAMASTRRSDAFAAYLLAFDHEIPALRTLVWAAITATDIPAEVLAFEMIEAGVPAQELHRLSEEALEGNSDLGVRPTRSTHGRMRALTLSQAGMREYTRIALEAARDDSLELVRWFVRFTDMTAIVAQLMPFVDIGEKMTAAQFETRLKRAAYNQLYDSQTHDYVVAFAHAARTRMLPDPGASSEIDISFTTRGASHPRARLVLK